MRCVVIRAPKAIAQGRAKPPSCLTNHRHLGRLHFGRHNTSAVVRRTAGVAGRTAAARKARVTVMPTRRPTPAHTWREMVIAHRSRLARNPSTFNVIVQSLWTVVRATGRGALCTIAAIISLLPVNTAWQGLKWRINALVFGLDCRMLNVLVNTLVPKMS